LIFWFILLLRKDRAGGLVFILLTGVAVGFFLAINLGIDAPYTIAAWQLFGMYHYAFLRYPAVLIIGGGVATLFIAVLLYRSGSAIVARAQRYIAPPLVRGLVILGLFVLAAYMFYFDPKRTDAAFSIPHSQVLPQTGLYLTPILFFASVAGLGLLIWRGLRAGELILVVFLALFANLFLWRYTTAAVYPVALRRLVPEVIPALVLLASYAAIALPALLRSYTPNYARGVLQIATIALLLASQLSVSWQYLFLILTDSVGRLRKWPVQPVLRHFSSQSLGNSVRFPSTARGILL
jgi:hypothetical protein